MPYGELDVRRGAFTVSGSTTDGALIAAATGKRYRLLSAVLSCVTAGASTLVFNSKGGSSGTAISATFNLAANGSLVLPHNPHGWFDTRGGEGLSASTGSNDVGLSLVWVILTDLLGIFTEGSATLLLESGDELLMEG